MKLVILAGGLGSRLSEETYIRPKPMVEIGNKPIIWHIMKHYTTFGINEFIICCGYKGYVIKEYFANYLLHTSDVTFSMDSSKYIEFHNKKNESWKVTLADTGESSQTGGRIKRVGSYINDQTFCLTYGDGLSNVNIQDLILHHQSSKSDVTLTAVKPPGRYGSIQLCGEKVESFKEKIDGDNSWVNGGFFVVEKNVLDLIENDYSSWEIDVLPKLAKSGKLNSFRHEDFWQSMDTLRDKNLLEKLWKDPNPPWKSW